MKPFCHHADARNVSQCPKHKRTQVTLQQANPTWRNQSANEFNKEHSVTQRANYQVPCVILTHRPTVTHKVRSQAHVQLKTCLSAYAAKTDHHRSMQQSHQATLVPSAFLSAISNTFNSLFKVLFIFPSWYLFAIGFEPIFSLR